MPGRDPGGAVVTILLGIAGAIVVPDVPGYPDDKIEIIAAVGLRAALGLRDGDTLALEVLS